MSPEQSPRFFRYSWRYRKSSLGMVKVKADASGAWKTVFPSYSSKLAIYLTKVVIVTGETLKVYIMKIITHCWKQRHENTLTETMTRTGLPDRSMDLDKCRWGDDHDQRSRTFEPGL
jgi:hypothetical protein